MCRSSRGASSRTPTGLRQGLGVLLLALTACRATSSRTESCSLDDHAREYVELVASLGARDPLSVDGPRPRPQTSMTAGLLVSSARDLRLHLQRVHATDPAAERRVSLIAQLTAVEARALQVMGTRMTVEDESAALLGVVREIRASPDADDAVLADLDAALPGKGPLADRLEQFEKPLQVPASRLPAVLARAIAACRDVTLAHINLPPAETLEVRYIDGSPWSGYSRYAGGFRSTLEVNTQLPLTVDRVLDLACHEGYPGHHALNVLREERLVIGLGRAEASVMPAFSPQSYALEGLASAAPRLVFPNEERLRLERDELFPLAGLQPADAALHLRVASIVSRLDPVITSLTRAYLAGELTHITAPAAFRAQAAMDRPEALLGFIDRYRTYSTAYTEGRATVWRSIATRSSAERWEIYWDMALRGSLDAGGRPSRPWVRDGIHLD